MARPMNQRNSETAKQQVVAGLLHELAPGAHAVEDLQQHRAQQLLGGDAGATALGIGGVHASEQRRHLDQRFVDHGTNGAQRMVAWNEAFQMTQGEQALVESARAAHVWRVWSQRKYRSLDNVSAA